MKKVLIVAFILISACGGSQKTDDGAAKMHDPPEYKPAVAPSVGPQIDPSVVRAQKIPVENRAEEGAPPAGAGEVSRAQVKDFMRLGPAFLLTRVEVEPVHADKGFTGFRLVKATDSVAGFMAPQMQVGDVVTHINGVRVERPDDYLQAWNALTKTEWIRVDFIRGDDALHAVWAIKD